MNLGVLANKTLYTQNFDLTEWFLYYHRLWDFNFPVRISEIFHFNHYAFDSKTRFLCERGRALKLKHKTESFFTKKINEKIIFNRLKNLSIRFIRIITNNTFI